MVKLKHRLINVQIVQKFLTTKKTWITFGKLPAKSQKERDAKSLAEKETDDALLKLSSTKAERDALKKKLDEVEVAIDVLKKERDEAIVEKQASLRRLECFHCFRNDNHLNAFLPCGHLVCERCCKEHYNTFSTPCPTCNVGITGLVKLHSTSL